MATRERIYLPNETYFLTFTVLDWIKIFTSEKYIELVYKWFDYMKDNYGNRIRGYVIMPNHIHCLTHATDKSPNISKLVQNAKRFMAYEIVRQLREDRKLDLLRYFSGKAERGKNASHKIFADGFDALIIQSQRFFLEKLNYMHNNPCQPKWGLAEAPEDYIHSSASSYTLGKGVYQIEVIDF